MANHSQAMPGTEAALAELGQLRQFAGPAGEFWPRFLGLLQQLTGGDKLVVVARREGQPWQRLMEWPTETPPSRMLSAFFGQLEEFAGKTAMAGGMVAPLDGKASSASRSFLVGSRVGLDAQQECVIALLLSESGEVAAREALVRLCLAVQTPEFYQARLAVRAASKDVEKLSQVLGLAVSVNSDSRFLAAALALCNEVANRFRCDRVSLGWLERGYVRLRAISHTEHFDRQMAAAQALELAMEETLDQDEEVVYPPPTGQSVVSRDHERFSQDQKVTNLCSLPVRISKAPVAVLLCERQNGVFTETEMQQLRLACDLAAPRLSDLHRHDLWFGAKWAAWVRDHSGSWLGPEHTWAKLGALLGVVALALLVFLRVPYRVEGSFTLRSDELVYLTSPFEAFIDQVMVRPGDAVAAGAPLLKLKTAELELDESFALADLNRFQREAEKARAARALADMRIAEAMVDQARARLETIRYRIEHAVIKSPSAGVVVEGDLRERLGSPVKTAEVLFKVARIDTLYAEAEVNERDVHEILGKSEGQIAFVSRPKNKFPVRVTAVEQAAVPKSEANVFLVRCALGRNPEPWWRPGMSGVCKFDVERRTLIWILTHRTVDFLRLKLWW